MDQKNLYPNAFTLVELLIVISILSIIVIITLPKFIDSSKNARESCLHSNLVLIRRALELYAFQHNKGYPNASDSDTFIKQLTHYTNQNHTISERKNGEYIYGPYLKHPFPSNPFAKSKAIAGQVYIITTRDPIGVFNVDPNKGGWLYKRETGEFIANIIENKTIRSVPTELIDRIINVKVPR